MPFDHEKLYVYRLAVGFSGWVSENEYEHDDDCEYESDHESCLVRSGIAEVRTVSLISRRGLSYDHGKSV
jgi:hypothetical protein